LDGFDSADKSFISDEFSVLGHLSLSHLLEQTGELGAIFLARVTWWLSILSNLT
jgi:hypothetical protein